MKSQFLSAIFLLSTPNLSQISIPDEPHAIKVFTGGYEAMMSIEQKTPISGPNTSKVRQFLDTANFKYSIETMPWSRAFHLNQQDNTSLIYPLTRTREREKQYDWILELERRRYHLLGHRSLEGKQLSKEEIVSGKYFAICEAAASSCELLRDFGFKEKSIIKVRGKSVPGIIPILASGRASFMIEDVQILAQPTFSRNYTSVIRIGDFVVEKKEYLAGYKLNTQISDQLKKLSGK